MTRTYDLTEGKVSKLILNFYFPMLLTNILQQLYTIADTAIVGKGLGDNALAAVGNMSSLTFLIIGFAGGLSNGFSVLIAQKYGAKDYRQLRSATASSVVLSVAISILLTIISIIFLKPVLVLLQTPDTIMRDSLIYGYIIFGGLITTIAYNLCSSILRAFGDSKTPFWAIMVSTIINIVLDIVFIFVFKTGVEGAAIATVIAQAVSTYICLVKLSKIDIIKLTSEDFKYDSLMYIALFRNGIPMAIMHSITVVGFMVIQYFVNGLGVAYTSAYSACSKYSNLFMQPAATAGTAMSSFTSQNYGAEKYKRIRKGLHVCMLIALITYLLLGSLMVIFPEKLAVLMLTGEKPIALAVEYLPICGSMLFAVNFLFVVRNGCQGMGSPFFPMLSGIAEMVIRIATIVLFISEIGFKATAYADVIAWFGALFINFVAFEVILNKKIKSASYLNPQP